MNGREFLDKCMEAENDPLVKIIQAIGVIITLGFIGVAIYVIVRY